MILEFSSINPLSANPTKWSNTLCLSVFDHFVGLALKGLTHMNIYHLEMKIYLEGAHISLPCIPQK